MLRYKHSISHRMFRMKQEGEYSELNDEKAGVPQVSMPGSIHTCDIRAWQEETVAIFEDDAALMSTEKNPVITTDKVQSASKRFLK